MCGGLRCALLAWQGSVHGMRPFRFEMSIVERNDSHVSIAVIGATSAGEPSLVLTCSEAAATSLAIGLMSALRGDLTEEPNFPARWRQWVREFRVEKKR